MRTMLLSMTSALALLAFTASAEDAKPLTMPDGTVATLPVSPEKPVVTAPAAPGMPTPVTTAATPAEPVNAPDAIQSAQVDATPPAPTMLPEETKATDNPAPAATPSDIPEKVAAPVKKAPAKKPAAKKAKKPAAKKEAPKPVAAPASVQGNADADDLEEAPMPPLVINNVGDLKQACSRQDTADQINACLNIISRGINNIRATEAQRGSRYVCNNEPLLNVKAREIFLRWASANPAYVGENPDRGILTALAQQYPCPTGNVISGGAPVVERGVTTTAPAVRPEMVNPHIGY